MLPAGFFTTVAFLSPPPDSFPHGGIVYYCWGVFIFLVILVGIGQAVLVRREKQTFPEKKEPEDDRRKTLRRRILAGILTSLMVFALWEGALRLGSRLFPDENYIQYRREMWTLRPEGSFEIQGAVVRSNSLGLREDPVGPRDPDETVILCMGDSWTIGQGVSREQTFVKQLESMLNRHYPGRKIRVVNGGMFGYSVLQGYNLLRELIPIYQPDIVIFCGFNQLANQELDLYQQEIEGTDGVKGLLNSFYFYRCLRSAFKDSSPEEIGAKKREPISRKKAWDLYIHYRHQIYSLCEENEITMLSFNHVELPRCQRIRRHMAGGEYPHPVKETPGGGLYVLLPWDPLLEEEGEHIDPVGEYRNIYYLTLCPSPEYSSRAAFFQAEDPTHPSSIGHYAIAQVLAGSIVDLNLIEPDQDVTPGD